MNSGNNVMMISLHDGRTSRIWWTKEDRMEFKDADLPSSMLDTMLKHGGGRATSQASKDGNNSSTLSLSLSF
jgi:4-alpha-glucanotransferase